jgi:hypothetical protein
MQADSEACFELLKSCDFGFVHQVLTFSRERAGSLLAASRELNTAAPDMLHELIVYGHHYLTPDEYRDTVSLAVSKYYDFLAMSVLHRRNRKFWDYHKGRLKEEGIPFSRSRVARTLTRRVVGALSRRLRRQQDVRHWGL